MAKTNYRKAVAAAIKAAAPSSFISIPAGAFTVSDDPTNPYAFVVAVIGDDGTTQRFRVITKEID